jgi:GNAT superfamily N-acetyltransferase
MNNESQKNQISLRQANIEDIPILAIHHRLMFEEIWELKGENIDTSIFNAIENSYIEKLQQQIEDDTSRAWVVENENKIVASGAISIVKMVPTPDDLSYEVAYLHSMYTERTHRNRKLASRIIDQTVQYCKSKGIKRILLNASEAGRPVYQKIGFRQAEDVMRLWLE